MPKVKYPRNFQFPLIKYVDDVNYEDGEFVIIEVAVLKRYVKMMEQMLAEACNAGEVEKYHRTGF